MNTTETGGSTVSICHPSRVEGVKALWTAHTLCWLEKCWLINMTSWHACHLRKPPVHRYAHASKEARTTHSNNQCPAPWTTQVTCSQMWPSTCDQHFSSCPPDTSVPPKNSQMCEGTDVKCGGYHLSREALMEEHVCTHGQSGWFTGRAVLTQFSNSPTTSLVILQLLIQILRSMSKTWQHRAHVSGQSDNLKLQEVSCNKYFLF